MGLFKRGSVWWMSFVYQGKQYRKTTETEDPKLAKRIFDKVKGEIAEGKWFERLPGEERTFREMMEKYMAEHSEPKKASSERDRSSLTHLLPVLGDHLLTEITTKVIADYKKRRRIEGASPCTINRELALLKHSFNIALKEWEWVQENPVLKISMEKEPPSRDRWLTYEQEERLLASSPPWLREIIIFAVETGCRRGEILSLEWPNVDLRNKVATIFGSKTGERRTIPLTQRALDVLLLRQRAKVRSLAHDLVFTHPEGKVVNIHTLREAFEASLRKAKVDGFRFHDLRHTFASRLAQAGVDPYTIQKLMGHKTFTTTQRYAHHYSESLKIGIRALEVSRATQNGRRLSQF
jgi:integrase